MDADTVARSGELLAQLAVVFAFLYVFAVVLGVPGPGDWGNR